MPNTKAIGVAYADPEFESVTVTGAITANSVASTSTITATSVTATGAVTGNTHVSTASSGVVALNANAGVYILSTAITATVTATTVPSGSLGITTNATGLGKLFYSDGAVWQFMAIT
jgi:hypothetical protein